MSAGELSVQEFTGGFTDDPTKASPNQYTVCDNLFITPEGTLVTRDGSDVVNSASPRPSIDRTVSLINYNFDNALLALSAQSVYSLGTSSWAELLGPTGNKALPESIGIFRVNYAEWREHIFLTDEAKSFPIKIYKDQNGAFQLRTAGLPEVPQTPNYNYDTTLAAAIILANQARVSLLAHYANTSAHPIVDSSSTGIVTAPAATDQASLFTLVGQLLKSYDQHTRTTKNGDLFHYAKVPNDINIRVAPQDYLVNSTEIPTTLVGNLGDPSINSAIISLNDLKTKFEHHFFQLDRHNDVTNEFGSSFYLADFLLDFSDGPLVQINRSSIYNYANTIRTKLNTHYASVDTVPTYDYFTHNVAADTDNVISTPTANSPSSLRKLILDLFISYNRHHDDAGDGAFTNLAWHIIDTNHDWYTNSNHNIYDYLGDDPDLIPDDFDGCGAGNWVLSVTRLNLLRDKYNGHLFDGISPVEAKKPHGTASNGSKQTFSVPGDDLVLSSYTYAFCWKYTYQVGSSEFIDRSNFLRLEAQDVISIDFEALALSNLPTLANASIKNYDTAAIVLEIYRTTDGGNVFYKSGEVVNGVTTYSDFVTDEILTSNEQAYITGGVVENDPPPKCKFLHIVNNVGYYGNIVDGVESLPNRVRASVPDDIDSCPGDFFTDLPYPNQGISSAKGVPIAWTDRSFYRIEGSFDETGQGAMVYTSISDNIGLHCPWSLVQIDNAVVFWGTDGIYMTDGYQYQKLTGSSDNYYRSLTETPAQRRAVQGAYDRRQRRVWWSTQSPNGSDSDICFLLDLTVPTSNNSSFQTASNEESFAPTAIGYFKDNIVRGDSRGYVLKHNPDYLTDPYINDTYVSGVTKAILPHYVGPASNLGNEHIRKLISKVFLKGRNVGNASIQINTIKDLGKVEGQCTSVRYRANLIWGDPTVVWGDPTVVWGPEGMLDEKRHFPAGSLRCTYEQIEITGAIIDLVTSTTADKATLVKSTKVFTRNDSTSWDSNILGFYIALGPNYSQNFKIVAQSGVSVTLDDPFSQLPADGSYDWVERGFPKNERWNILSYLVPYDYLGETMSSAQGESS